jgi:hypothetical protein
MLVRADGDRAEVVDLVSESLSIGSPSETRMPAICEGPQRSALDGPAVTSTVRCRGGHAAKTTTA